MRCLLAACDDEAASFLQRRLKGILAKKHLRTDLTQVQQVPKIVAELLTLIQLRASGDQNAKMRETILLKALPRIFTKVNVLLRFQSETRCFNSVYAANLVTLVEHFASSGLTKFEMIREEIELLIERLYQAVLA